MKKHTIAWGDAGLVLASCLLILGGVFLTVKPAGAQYNQMNPGQNIQKTGYSASTVTTETLAIGINPTTGTDPGSSVGVWSSQAQYDAWGKFASVKGIVTVLPRTLNHDVTLTIDDGTYVVGTDFFDGMGALSVAQVGVQLTIESASKLLQVGGTVTSTIAGSVGGYSLTLTADPGYGANAYRGYWLVITSGTGAGQYKAIRSHNGINFEVAGRFSPIDGTSQVQIQNEAVELTMAAIPTIGLPNWQYLYLTTVATNLSGIQISANYVEFVSGSIEFDACEIGSGGFGIWFYNVLSVETNNLIVNGGNYGAVMFQGGVLRCGTADSSALFRGMTSYGIYGAGRYSSIYLCKTALDDNLRGVYVEEGNLNLYNGTGTGNTIGIEMGQDSSLQIDISTATTRGVTGTTTEVSLAGDYYTYTEINNERSATVQPDGNLDDYVKVLRVESGTTTGAGTLTYVLAGTTLAYTAPGDAIGAAVNIGAGGEFILKSNNTKWIQVWVNPTIPAGNTSDTFTVGTARIENQGSIMSVY